MSELTMRSKIAVRWSSLPVDVGYPSYPSQPDSGWRDQKPEIMSVRKALDFDSEISDRIGVNVFRVIYYQHNGAEISKQELSEIVNNAEWIKYNK